VNFFATYDLRLYCKTDLNAHCVRY